jgi:hypothetical protein
LRTPHPPQLAVQSAPDTGALPLRQAAVCGRRRAAHLARQVLPRDPGEQHEDDRGETHAVIDARAAATRITLVHRKQRLDDLPQLVTDLPQRLRHRDLLAGLCLPDQIRRPPPKPSRTGIETAS